MVRGSGRGWGEARIDSLGRTKAESGERRESTAWGGRTAAPGEAGERRESTAWGGRRQRGGVVRSSGRGWGEARIDSLGRTKTMSLCSPLMRSRGVMRNNAAVTTRYCLYIFCERDQHRVFAVYCSLSLSLFLSTKTPQKSQTPTSRASLLHLPNNAVLQQRQIYGPTSRTLVSFSFDVPGVGVPLI